MTMLSEHGALFLGQSIVYDGQRMHDSFKGVPLEQKIEMPIVEEFQMGFCTGLSLQGYLPVCVYPRMDFLILAMNQLVNHLDKLPMFGWKPKVIIRVAVGSSSPFNPGPQHTQDHSEALRLMLRTVQVIRISKAEFVMPSYKWALECSHSTILVESSSEYSK